MEEVNNCNLSVSFADYFNIKVKSIVNSCKVDGNKNLTCVNENFINQTNVMRALASIKIKNTK